MAFCQLQTFTDYYKYFFSNGCCPVERPTWNLDKVLVENKKRCSILIYSTWQRFIQCILEDLS